MVWSGLQLNTVEEVETVAGAPPAVWCLNAPADDEAGRAQGRDGSGGDVADTDGRPTQPCSLSRAARASSSRAAQASGPVVDAKHCIACSRLGQRPPGYPRLRRSRLSAGMTTRSGEGWIAHQ